MKAQVLPAITASVMRTKPTAMDLEIRSSSVPSGGQPVVEFARLLGFQLALLEEVEQGSHRGEQQRGVAQQDQHDVDGEPGRRARSGCDQALTGLPEGGDQRHHEDQREDEDAEALHLVAPVDEQDTATATRKAHIDSVS